MAVARLMHEYDDLERMDELVHDAPPPLKQFAPPCPPFRFWEALPDHRDAEILLLRNEIASLKRRLQQALDALPESGAT